MHCRRLVALLIFGAVVSVAGADARPLLISCHGGPKTDANIVATLCDTLVAELGERDPERVIRQRATSDTAPGQAWNVVLKVTRTEAYHWKAHLAWGKTDRRDDGKRTTGPPVEIFGMDAPLDQGAYSRLVRSLLKVSKPEFLASPRGVEPLLPP